MAEDIQLIPNAMIAEAIAQTGLTDFGDAPMMEGLQALCRSLQTEVRLTEEGRSRIVNELVNVLAQRLQVEDWYKRHPEIDAVEIKAPLFIMGLPRSGTSALSQFFAEDPQMRTLRRWELEWPTPPPTADGQANDPRRARMQALIDARDAEAPERKAKINTIADDPGENGVLLKYTFLSIHFIAFAGIPTYLDWLWKQDLVPGYAYMNRVLKLLLWKCPPEQWNLRHPMDIMAIDAILAVWPDARLVWSHRDPAKTIPSAISLTQGERVQFSPIDDLRADARGLTEAFHEMVRRGLRSRSTLAPGRIVDVYNVDLVRDPVGALSAAYLKLGLEFSEIYKAQIQERMRVRPKGQFGEHKPDLDAFGITPDGVRKFFAEYIEQCRVPIEG